MHKFETCGRSMRWYEWLAALLLLVLAGGLRAQPVYKCTAPDGGVAYQDKACGAQQLENELQIAPPPPVQPSPQYALARDGAASPGARAARPGGRRRMWTPEQEKSFECRASNGDVFYRHGACPHSIASSGADARKAHAGNSAAQTLKVSSRQVSRAEACAQMRRAGAIGRNGHEHDETVSTYERNLGRDPCR